MVPLGTPAPLSVWIDTRYWGETPTMLQKSRMALTLELV